MKPLAKKLHDLRISNGCISQRTLSKLTGISQSSLARWELGQSEPCASEIAVLCRYYKISADELLGIVLDAETPSPSIAAYDSHARRDKF